MPGRRVDTLAELEARALAFAPLGEERTVDPIVLLADFVVGHDLDAHLVDEDGDWSMVIQVGVLS